MANWSTTTKHEPSSINNGRRYELRDRVSIEQLNNMTENAFYAMEASSVAKEKAEQALEHAVSGGSRVLENGQFVAEFNADKKVDTATLEENYYNKQQVDDILASGSVDVDLSDYYKKSETYSKEEVDDKLANLDVDIDFSDYYTKTQTDSLLVGKADKSELGNYVTTESLENKGYLTEIPSEYVTETELNSKGYLTEVPSEYITESELNKKGYLTAIPSEYITEAELTAKGYATTSELQSGLSVKADQTSLDTTNSNVSTLQEKVETLEIDNSKNKTDIANLDNTRAYKSDVESLQNTKADKSEIPFVGNFITRAVDDLVNYYTKSETYTQAEVRKLVSTIPKFSVEVITGFPTNPSETTIYILKTSDKETGNLYTEYIYVNGAWEKLGTQTLDLSGYVTTEELNKNYYTKDIVVAMTNTLNETKADKTELPYVADFITKFVDDLVNYYKKSEIYTKTETDGLLTTALETKADKTELDIYVTEEELETTLASKGYLTEIPDNYITEEELRATKYVTESELEAKLILKGYDNSIETLSSDVSILSNKVSTIKNQYLKDASIGYDASDNSARYLYITKQDGTQIIFDRGEQGIELKRW